MDIRILAAVLLGIVSTSPVAAAASDETVELVTTQLAQYRHAYPQIQFVWLRNPRELKAIMPLPQLLGADASNLDYEHPQDVRELLLQAQTTRIRAMVSQRQPSATLFKTGQHSHFKRRFLCVITLDATVFQPDSAAALRLFLPTAAVHLDGRVSANINFDNRQALRFTLNHELFHCLDAYRNGPSFPRTSSDAQALYYRYRAEYRADFFAALLHRMRGDDPAFIRTLGSIRSLGLLDCDLEHYTTAGLQAAAASELPPDAANPYARAVTQVETSSQHRLLSSTQFSLLKQSAANAVSRYTDYTCAFPTDQSEPSTTAGASQGYLAGLMGELETGMKLFAIYRSRASATMPTRMH